MTEIVSKVEGIVTRWNDDKGYGFIERQGAHDVFVHMSALIAGTAVLTVGDRVRFDVEASPRGDRRHERRADQRLREETPVRQEGVVVHWNAGQKDGFVEWGGEHLHVEASRLLNADALAVGDHVSFDVAPRAFSRFAHQATNVERIGRELEAGQREGEQ